MKKTSIGRAFASLVLIAALFAQGAAASAGTTGSFTGTVTDAGTRLPLSGVKVSAVSPSQTASAVTDAQGHFTFLSLAPDSYTVSAQKEGYEDFSQAGITVQADQTQTLAIALQLPLKTIARVRTRPASSLIKPGVTSDVYSVDATTQQAVQGLGGGGGLNNAYSGIASVPGVYVPQGQTGWAQSVYVRGADYTQLGYEYDGVPVQRAFDAYPAATLSALGQQELQVYTGSQPVDAQSTGLGGFINQVIRTGTYPGFTDLSGGFGGPAFYHHLSAEIGGASKNHLFSYFLAYGGYNQENRFGSQYNGNDLTAKFGAGTTYNIIANNCGTPNATVGCYSNFNGVAGATPAGPNGFAVGPVSYGFGANISDREAVANLHFGIPHHGDSGHDDIQFLYSNSSLYTNFNTDLNSWGSYAGDITNGTITQANGTVLPPCNGALTNQPCANLGPFAGVPAAPFYFDGQVYTGAVGTALTAANLSSTANYFFPSSPTNRAFFANVAPNANGGTVNNAAITKLQYQKNIGSNAYFRIYGYTFYSDWLQNDPNSLVGNLWGPLPEDYELSTHTSGLSATFADQISSEHLLNLTGSFTTAGTTRWYNEYFLAHQVAALVDSTNPTNGICYTVNGGPGTPAYCGSASSYVLSGAGGGPLVPGHATDPTVQNAGSFTCGSGPCEYYVVENGTVGLFNTVRPRFSTFSISDNWTPSDKLLFNLGLRYDNFTYDLANSAGGPARLLWQNSYNAFHCYSVATGITSTTTPNVCPAGESPVAFSNAAAPSNTFTEWQPRLGLTFRANPFNVIRASYGIYAQPADSAYQEYNVAQQNLAAYDAPKFYGFGFTNPGHAIPPAVSNNFDISWEHQVRNSDLSWKVTPFYRTTKNQLATVLLDAKTNFVSSINVGQETASGVELDLAKGSFSRDGFAGQLSFTYTNATEKFQGLANGTTVVDGLNLNVLGYNQYTSYCASNPTSSLCSSTRLNFTPTPTGPCYDTAGNPIATAAACTAADIQNPYWNAKPQSLFDPGASYAPFNQFPSGAGPTGVAGSYVEPYVATLILNYKRHKWAFTPSLQLAAGGKYGTPLAATGVQPGTCTGNLAATGTDPRNPNSSGAGSLYDAQTCSGSIGIPNPFTGKFDNLGAFTQPSQLAGNLQVSYQATPRVQLVLTMVNVFTSCFGGSNEPWNVGAPACGYSFSPLPYVGNFYNPGNAIQNGAQYPYGPAIGNVFQQIYQGQSNPFEAFFNVKIKV